MKSSRLVFVGFAVFVLLALSLFVIAQEDAADAKMKETKRNDFNSRVSHIMCRVDLTKKQIDLLSRVNGSLDSYKVVLDADVVKLKEFVSAMDHKGFGGYFTTIFKDDLKNAVVAVRDAKLDVRKANLTREEKTTLKDSNKAAIAEFANCTNKAEKDWSDKRADHLNSWIDKWNKIITRMKGKGYDTTGMESVVSDAQTKLLPALQAIKDAATKEARKTAMENARNLHLHLWATFEIARIKSLLMYVDDGAIAKGYQVDVDAINVKLDEAAKLAISGKKYKEAEFETVWSAIRDAAKMLKDLNKKLKA